MQHQFAGVGWPSSNRVPSEEQNFGVIIQKKASL